LQIEVSYIERDVIEEFEVPKSLEKAVKHLTHAYAVRLRPPLSGRYEEAEKYLKNSPKTNGGACEEVLKFVDNLNIEMCEDSPIYITTENELVYAPY